MLIGRYNWILLAFAVPIALFLLFQAFGTTWSNRCDPGNANFYLLKNDPVTSFWAGGQLFSWDNAGPDNGWLCDTPTFSISHVGPDVNKMFDETMANMTANGWVGGDIIPQAPDFTTYQKTVDGAQLDAIVRKEAFWVEVDLQAPGLHLGEYGFSS
jgi:hypothetical protein